MGWRKYAWLLFLLSTALSRSAAGGDWLQFRGPGGSGASADARIPLQWSDARNVRWKTALPGPGASSPIVSGGYVFVTCYSGYGVDPRDPGRMEDLKRHLLCIERTSGKIAWACRVDAALPEDSYGGMGLTEHGYASNSPVTDGQRVYAFFGKSGVLAFDIQGRQLWRADVGHESSNRRWGSAASLILCDDMLIVNASEESQPIRAFDKLTGKERWKTEASSLELTYATPTIVELSNGRKELVLGVPNEVWGMNPETGKLKWYAATQMSGNVGPSPVAHNGVVYLMGGYPQQQSVAIRAGGKGDVARTHVLWSSRDSSYIPSPVLHNGNLYWVNDQGVANCVTAATGKSVYHERIPQTAGTGRRKAFYASVVLSGERLYAVSRTGGTYVLLAKPTFAVLAQNQLASDASDFNASPAISDGQLFLRSNRFLYCIAAH